MRILSITSLYPNNAQPNHGVFVENRLRHISGLGGAEFRVVAPVPWFPFRSTRFGRYGVYARVVDRETRFGIAVDHPRYPVIPRFGMTAAPYLMFHWLRPFLSDLIARGFEFDLIDAHYFYPDGVSAAHLARVFKKPLVITARGVDINRIPDFYLPRKMIQWAAGRAAALITVSESLKLAIERLGIDPRKVHALRNGVDLELFRPVDGRPFRERWALGSPVLLSIGHLIPRKGHEYVIRALLDLPHGNLVIVGNGPDEQMLKRLTRMLGLSDRVRFVGSVAHGELAQVYSAADVMILASRSEGWANVLLEALACGTPVVATSVGGTPEVITSPDVGRLLSSSDPSAIAREVDGLLRAPPSRAQVRRYAEKFGWAETARRQLALYRGVAAAQLE